MLDKYEDIDAPQLIKMYDEEICGFFDTHVSSANLLLPRIDLEQQKDRIYTSNKSIWGDVLADRLRATLTLTLKDFLLFKVPLGRTKQSACIHNKNGIKEGCISTLG
jgi:hypothetical protein